MFHIEIRDTAIEDLARLPKNIQDRVLRAIEERLASAPDRYGRRLRRSLQGLWRVRSGDLRVVYEIFPARRRVVVWAVLPRRVVYKEILRRWMGGRA